MSPDSRVSRRISTCGRSAGDWRAAARANERASSALRNSPATPRTPSVPNSLRAMLASEQRLALGDLRPLAGILEACLLALLGPRVARQETPALELTAQVGIRLKECARDAVAQGARLG